MFCCVIHIMVRKTASRKNERIVAEEIKRKQGYDMIEKGIKNSVIAKELHVDRRMAYNWRIRKEKEIDWKRKNRKAWNQGSHRIRKKS